METFAHKTPYPEPCISVWSQDYKPSTLSDHMDIQRKCIYGLMHQTYHEFWNDCEHNTMTQRPEHGHTMV